MSAIPPIRELIPHADPMVLLDAMTEWQAGSASCALHVREGAPFVVDGRVNSVVTIEYMAQAIAACLGYEAFQGGIGVRVGMIIGCRRFDIAVPFINVGCDATIDVERVRGNDVLSHFEGRVSVGDETVATALLTLYHADKPPD